MARCSHMPCLLWTVASTFALAATPVTLLSGSVPAPDASSSAAFANSIALTDSFAIVGAPLAVTNGVGCGAAFLYARPAIASYTLTTSLVPVDGVDNDYFGCSVAGYTSSDASESEWVLVGAAGKTVSGVSDTGAAYLYSRPSSAGTWALMHAFADDSAGGAAGSFGAAVAMASTPLSSAPTLFMAAPTYSTAMNVNQGAVYVFAMMNGTWVKSAILLASDAASSDAFGSAIAVAGAGAAAYLLVGANSKSVSGRPFQGVVYGFGVRQDVNGSYSMQQVTRFTASDGAAEEFFGSALVMSSAGFAVVCAPSAAVGNVSNAGAAYVFARSGNTWVQQQRLTTAAAAGNDTFCTSVSMDAAASNVLIGAPGAAAGPLPSAGTAYFFTRYGNVWAEITQLTAPDAAAGDTLGHSVALNSGSFDAIIGAPGKVIGSTQGVGAMYTAPIAGSMPSRTASPSMTVTRSPSTSSSVTATASETSSVTLSSTSSSSVTSTVTSTFVPPSTSATTTVSISASITASGSITPSITASSSVSGSITPTTALTVSITPSTSVSPSISASVTLSGRPSLSSSTRASVTPSPTLYASVTASSTLSPSSSASVSSPASASPSTSVPARTASPTPSSSPDSAGLSLQITHDDEVLQSLTVTANRAPQLLTVRAIGRTTVGCALACKIDDLTVAVVIPSQILIAAGAVNASMDVRVWAPPAVNASSVTRMHCTVAALDSSVAFGARVSMIIVRVATRLPVLSDIVHVRAAPGSIWFTSSYSAPLNVTAFMMPACSAQYGRACSVNELMTSVSAVATGLEALQVHARNGALTQFAAPGDQIILMGDASGAHAPFTPDVTVLVNGERANITLISSFSLLMRVPAGATCSSNNFSSTAAACDGLASIAVSVPATAAALGATLRCPLTCLGDFQAFPLTSDGLSYTPAQLAAPAQPPTPVEVLAVPRTGLFIGQPCSDAAFTPIYTRACVNSTDVRSLSCGYGEGVSCTACPVGALCPGGKRVWPLPGFTTSCEACTAVRPCVWPALQRCLGWNSSLARVQCGDGYAGPACAACANGYFRSTRGDCTLCPPSEAALDALARLAFTVVACIVAAAAAALLVHTATIKSVDERWRMLTPKHLHRVSSTVVFVMSQLQIVAQVTYQLPAGSSPLVAGTAKLLQTFQWWKGEFTAAGACHPHTPFAGVLSIVTLSLICAGTIAGLLTLYVLAYFPSFRRSGSSGVAYHTVADMQAAALTPSTWRAAWTVCIFAWLLLLPGTLNAAASLVECTPVTMNVRGYVALQQDGRALSTAQGDLLTTARRQDLLMTAAGDAVLPVSVLAGNARVVCYESSHEAAAAAAWLAIIACIGMIVGIMMALPHYRHKQLQDQIAQVSAGTDVTTSATTAFTCCTWRRHARLHGNTRGSLNNSGTRDAQATHCSSADKCCPQLSQAVRNDPLLQPFIALSINNGVQDAGSDPFSPMAHAVLISLMVVCDRFTPVPLTSDYISSSMLATRMICLLLSLCGAAAWMWWRSAQQGGQQPRGHHQHRLWYSTLCMLSAGVILVAVSADALRQQFGDGSVSVSAISVTAVVLLLLATAGMLLIDTRPTHATVDAAASLSHAGDVQHMRSPITARRASARGLDVAVVGTGNAAQSRRLHLSTMIGVRPPVARRVAAAARKSSAARRVTDEEEVVLMEMTPVQRNSSGVSV